MTRFEAPSPRAAASASASVSQPGHARRVIVAMSGGVDSAVTAALMLRAGHEVVGVTLQLYDHGKAVARSGACCAGQDIHDARRVAAQLGIAHYVLDYEARFADTVMAAFAESYIAGETPIPCVTCNQKIKFSALLDTVGELGAGALATGHYVELRHGANGPELYRGADPARDQSYFLFATTRGQLQRLVFPLGTMPKPQVRTLARELGLPVAEKRDSQDICFVPAGRYGDVIERLRPEATRPGDIVHVDGRTLARHGGIINFTVGQRRGLGLATGEPLFVVRVDAATQQVIVGPRESLYTNSLRLRDVNWIGEGAPPAIGDEGIDLYVRLRSTQEPRPARLSSDRDGNCVVRLAVGDYGIAPGQACVFYADQSTRARVLGGGFIAGLAQGMRDDRAPAPIARVPEADKGAVVAQTER